MAMEENLDYGIVCNVLEADRALRKGAKAWITGGTGGTGWERFQFIAMSRGGRHIEKWAPTVRFDNFRVAWVPEHLRSTVTYFRGTREDMTALAAELSKFADGLRADHQNRRGATPPSPAAASPCPAPADPPE